MKKILMVCGFVLGSCFTLGSALAQGAPLQKDCELCPELVQVPAGSYTMGRQDGLSNERPEHKVTLDAFYLGRMEVTQAQWKAVMNSTPSANGACGPQCPVDSVNWDEVQEYLAKLSALSGKTYRLPSEAEWEYAARAGTSNLYVWGDMPSREYANYGSETCCEGLAEGRDAWVHTAPVGSFPPNAFGLFDMLGNVAEWTQDVFYKNYMFATKDGSAWVSDAPGAAFSRVVRGGAWNQDGASLRATKRAQAITTEPSDAIGFRVARSL